MFETYKQEAFLNKFFSLVSGLNLSSIDMDKLSETNIWADVPTKFGIIMYSVIVPAISFLGVIGNTLILAVLSRRSLKASTYTYLAGNVIFRQAFHL